MATTLTRPTDDDGATIYPSRSSWLVKPRAIRTSSISGVKTTRDLGNTKRMWTETYPPMRRNASVKAFLDNLQTYMNVGTELSVQERVTGDNTSITCYLDDISQFEVRPPKTVMGLTLTFVES